MWYKCGTLIVKTVNAKVVFEARSLISDFSKSGIYNPHALTDNLIGRKNRFKVVTGIDLSGNPGEVRTQLNSMIKEGKGNKALTETVTRINNGETITDADINSIAENREYISSKYGIEITGSTDAEIKRSATRFSSSLKERTIVLKNKAAYEELKSMKNIMSVGTDEIKKSGILSDLNKARAQL